MNDRLLQPPATSQEHERIEMVKKNQQEYHLIGRAVARAGHTLFEYNKETHKVRRADVKRTMYVSDFKTGEVTFKYRPSAITVCYRKLKDRLAQLLLGSQRSQKRRGVHTETLHLSEYEVGDRVGQLIIIPYPKVEFEEVEKLSDSDRGTNGYGSTGN